MLDALEAEKAVLKGIGFFGEIDDYEGDFELFNVSAKGLSDAARSSGKMIFSNLVAYETID